MIILSSLMEGLLKTFILPDGWLGYQLNTYKLLTQLGEHRDILGQFYFRFLTIIPTLTLSHPEVLMKHCRDLYKSLTILLYERE